MPEYEEVPALTRVQVEAAIERDDPDELPSAVLSAALHSDDPEWAESVCRKLADHPHFNVRGNAILGFAHLARLHRRLDEAHVKPLVARALDDPSDYVRAQAEAAKDDLVHFLSCGFVRRGRGR